MNPLPFHSLLVALADAAFKSLALFALAGLIAAALRKRSAAARHLVWCAALGGALVLPALSLSLPHLQVPFLPRWAAWAETGDARPSAPIAPPSHQGQPAVANKAMPVGGAVFETWNPTPMPAPDAPWIGTSSVIAPSAQLTSPPHLALPMWLALAWLAGSLLSLVPLLSGCWQISHVTRRVVHIADPRETTQLQGLCAQLGLRRKVDLRRSSQIAMPLTWGAWRPVLLLPEAFAGWSPERRQLVLLHELAHVQRWDWLGQIAGRVACALYWFNPLAWLAARQMRLEREQACDDLVLATGTAPGVYAEELLQIATGMGGPGWLTLATVPMAHRSSPTP